MRGFFFVGNYFLGLPQRRKGAEENQMGLWYPRRSGFSRDPGLRMP